jgi:hypothetical protein
MGRERTTGSYKPSENEEAPTGDTRGFVGFRGTCRRGAHLTRT